MGKHTPTPWRDSKTGRIETVDTTRENDGEDYHTTIAESPFNHMDNQEWIDNAAFIVHACNMHEALIKALEATIPALLELGLPKASNSLQRLVDIARVE